LVLGVLGFLLLGLTGIPGVICGHLALGKIKRSRGTLSGGGLAIAGLITSYLATVMLLLAALSIPSILHSLRQAKLIEATSNARATYTLLIPFQAEMGSFPSDETAAKLQSEHPTLNLTGTSANAYLRQLLASGLTSSEVIFYAASDGTHRPDNNISGANALAAGECGFAYVTGNNISKAPDRPMLMTPFIPGTQRFDPDRFGRSKAVVLFLDGSVQVLPIDAAGHALLDGRNILDPDHPCWHGDPPVLAMPE
jgi:type II secretory pathway pseudopilin PulG